MVSEARINSHNERPEGVEAALWISNVSGEMRWARFNQLADILAVHTAEVQPPKWRTIMQMGFLRVIESFLTRIFERRAKRSSRTTSMEGKKERGRECGYLELVRNEKFHEKSTDSLFHKLYFGRAIRYSAARAISSRVYACTRCPKTADPAQV